MVQTVAKLSSILISQESRRSSQTSLCGVPIAFIKDGDRVRIDIKARTLDLLVDPAELEARKVGWQPLPHKFTRGVLAKYSKTVGSASKGAVCG